MKRVDRNRWREGPWHDEPEDELDFVHAGLPCAMRRNTLGAWCGYVGVPPDRVLNEAQVSSLGDVEVHGGVTYQDIVNFRELPGGDAEKVLATLAPWNAIGFDCAHLGDAVPGMTAVTGEYNTYRTRDWAMAETKRLAERVAAIVFVFDVVHVELEKDEVR